MIVVLRHGERADNSPFESDQQQIKLSYDPHLTPLGLLQAQFTGVSLEKILLEANPSLKKVLMVSSPFLRCLQTANEVSNKMKNLLLIENMIFTQLELGEMLRGSWFSSDVNGSLVSQIDQEYLKQLVQKEVQITSFVTDSNKLIKPEYPEDKLGKFYDRFKVAYQQELPFFLNLLTLMKKLSFTLSSQKNTIPSNLSTPTFSFIFSSRVLIDQFLSTYDSSDTALVIVTHGFGVQVILDSLGVFSFNDLVDYCSINVFDCSKDQHSPKIVLKQHHEHLKQAEDVFKSQKNMQQQKPSI